MSGWPTGRQMKVGWHYISPPSQDSLTDGKNHNGNAMERTNPWTLFTYDYAGQTRRETFYINVIGKDEIDNRLPQRLITEGNKMSEFHLLCRLMGSGWWSVHIDHSDGNIFVRNWVVMIDWDCLSRACDGLQFRDFYELVSACDGSLRWSRDISVRLLLRPSGSIF